MLRVPYFQCVKLETPLPLKPAWWHSRPAVRRNSKRFVPKTETDITRTWKTPLAYTTADPVDVQALSNKAALTDEERRALEQLRELATKEHCSMLLYENFTSNYVKSHRPEFVCAFLQEARKLDMLVVLDDTMCSVRCGRFFSYEYYDTTHGPDMVLIGKHWVVSALVCIDKPVAYSTCHAIRGCVTTEADWLTLRRALHFARTARGAKLPQQCEKIGAIVRESLGHLCGRVSAALLSGVGSMWFTNIRLSNNAVRRTMCFKRMLPLFTVDLERLCDALDVDDNRPLQRSVSNRHQQRSRVCIQRPEIQRQCHTPGARQCRPHPVALLCAGQTSAPWEQ